MPAIILLTPGGSISVASRTISFFASSVANAATITLASGIQAGDIIILWDHPISPTALPTLVVPTGFTQAGSIFNSVASGSGFFSRGVISYKLANGGEGGSAITGMSSDSDQKKVAMVFRPNFTPTTLTSLSVNGEMTTGNPALQTVSSGSGAAPLIVFGFYGQTVNTISTRTFSPSEDAEITNGTATFFAKYKIYNGGASLSNHSVDMPDAGDLNALQSFYLEAA